jgi:hypothetical protein
LKVVEHSGGDAGYRSHLMRFPDQRFSVACLCNLGGSGPSQFARKVADIYLADQLKPDAPKDNPDGVKLSEKELADKAGVYWASNSEELGRVTLMGGQLFFAFDGGSFVLIPLSEKRFQISAFDGEVMFESPSEGLRRIAITSPGRSKVILDALAPATPSAERLAEYAGDYYSEEIDSVYKLTVLDGKLTMKRKKYRPVEMTPVAKDVFTAAGSGSIRFTRDKRNRVTGLVLSRGRIKNFRFDRLSSQRRER